MLQVKGEDMLNPQTSAICGAFWNVREMQKWQDS